MKIFLSCILLLLISDAHAALTFNPDFVKRSTVFLFAADPTGNVDVSKPLGTGFLVSIPVIGTDNSYIVLLTARHVLNPSWIGCAGGDPSLVYIRLNTRAYDAASGKPGVGYVALRLRGSDGSLGYRTPTDDQLDAAVAPLQAADFPNGQYDLATVRLADFATDEELTKLGTGDAIVSAGLLPGAQGVNRNYPVFKFGFVSDNRPEPFATSCGPGTSSRLEKVWLISINMFPGASGSAIYYAPPGSGGVQFGAPVMRPVLIGIQSSSVVEADVATMTAIGPAFEMIESLHLPNANLHRGPEPPKSNPIMTTPK